MMQDEQIDPLHATGSQVGRGAFIGISAGAALSGAVVVEAMAAAQLGKPHPPFVAEDDPSISVERPVLTVDGMPVDAYAAYPKNASHGLAGIVVTQHIWGVDAQIRDTVRRLAKEQYVVIAPDLYSGQGAPNGDNATDYAPFAAIAQQLTDKQIHNDLAAGATWIRARDGAAALQRPPKVGIMGFCMGGALALHAAADTPSFDALVIFYGSVRSGGDKTGSITDAQLAYTDRLRMPVMGQYGERDTSIPADDVRAFQKRLQVPNDIKIYGEAGHAFFDDTRERYVASAAADAWQRTLSWFSKHLKS